VEVISGGEEGTHAEWFEHPSVSQFKITFTSCPVPYLTREEEEEKEAHEVWG